MTSLEELEEINSHLGDKTGLSLPADNNSSNVSHAPPPQEIWSDIESGHVAQHAETWGGGADL